MKNTSVANSFAHSGDINVTPTPNEPNKSHNTPNKHNSNIINNIIIIRNTQPGVRISPEDGERICAAYMDAIGSGINGPVARMIESFIAAGHTVDQLLDAIERTSWARYPSPKYLRVVLQNYDKSRPAGQSGQPQPWYKQNPALNYPQREYRDEDFDGDAFMNEARAILANQKEENNNA